MHIGEASQVVGGAPSPLVDKNFDFPPILKDKMRLRGGGFIYNHWSASPMNMQTESKEQLNSILINGGTDICSDVWVAISG